ncbi:asparagine--tRNA ligase [Candidatus Aerophobetes bacterium]|uniref:Asparagine--tRNA ligase n=1 Tax=Aerophobetes bacterium TaxID=2030807 RepID=A0A2A4YD89_UNCAE|nr:MAG: asparagine--tRNA ligase [Candidatus Aerophobetes bacterium]
MSNPQAEVSRDHKRDLSIKELKNLSSDDVLGKTLSLCGWIKSARHQKTFSFIALSDGSTFAPFQIVAASNTEGYDELLSELNTGASIKVTGTIVQSPGKGQSIEMKAEKIHLFGTCKADFPLQKKRHSFEYLRTIAHLRPRTNTQGAVARVRNALSFASHTFFQKKDFMYLQSPILTAADCEGAGELFQVTTLPLNNIPKTEENEVDYKKDFFAKPVYLAVSGQLNGEAYATAFSNIYTFGPTFRAENSNTSRHLSEFWMIEPEMAFADLEDIMNIAEEYLKFVLNTVLESCKDDLAFFDQFIEKGLLSRLDNVINADFARISYTEAVEILHASNKKFEYPIEWGSDLQSEHERYISEEHFKRPVILYDYPKDIKAFYMRLNDDGKTVRAMDVLVPRIGELMGGSQREERLEILEEKIKAIGMKPEDYSWYLDLRRFGTVPHAGFGIGFERLVQFATGIENIRDAIAFPRVPNSCEF